MGLFAETARIAPNESAHDQARRLGRALAHILLSPIPSAVLAQTRHELVQHLAGLGPDWWLALDSLAPGALAQIEPRGSLTSAGTLVTQDLEAARTTLLRGPLRLAVLNNADKGQAEEIERQLQLAFGGLRATPFECPGEVVAAAEPGLYRLQTEDVPLAAVLIGTRLPPELLAEAEATTVMLNRPGGSLAQLAATTAAIENAEARLMGGDKARVLVIEVHPVSEASAEDAALATREFLESLAIGGAGPSDVSAAQVYFQRRHAERSLDPRFRLVDLWLPRPAVTTAPTLRALRSYQNRIFSQDNLVVVLAEQRH
jgi:hypothetical protein